MSTNKVLTEQELNTVLEFAQALYKGVGVYSPYTQRDNMVNLYGNNTAKPVYEDLLKELGKQGCDYTKLTEYSSFMATYDTLYTKTLRYYIGLLSFNLTYTCINAKAEDYKSKAYADDVARVRKFFNNFSYLDEFKRIAYLMLEKDIVYTWFRGNKALDQIIDLGDKAIEKFALQLMPQDYCTISGYYNGCTPLYDFDLSYFDMPTVDIDTYPNFFKVKLRESLDTDKQKAYVPSNSLNRRNGMYASQWVQTSPKDGAWCWKFDNTTAEQKPPFIALIKSCLSNDEVEELQKNKDLASAYLILAGEIATFKDTQAKKQDATVFTPQTLGSFLNLVNNGLAKSVKPVALPTENIKGLQYQDGNLSMVKNKFSNTVGQGASASELIFHGDNLSQFAMENAIYMDYNFVKTMYSQFSQFLNYFVNKKTKKFKFNFTLDGLDRDWYNKQRKETISSMADKGLVLPPCYWAGCLNMNPFDFERAIIEAHNGDMTENLTMLLNANTMTDNSGSVSGRPTKDGLDKSDKTEANQSL